MRQNTANVLDAKNSDHFRLKPDRFEKTVRHYWHHDVELEISVSACPGDGRVVADHLRAYHHHRFAHHGIDFSRHDRAAGLRRGQLDFAECATRPASEPANVVRDLEKTHRDRF